MIAIPAIRMTGLYLTIASLAFAIVVEDVIIHWESVTGGNRGMLVDAPILFGYEIFEAGNIIISFWCCSSCRLRWS